MANIKSAKKRAIQTEKRNARNRSVRSTLRTAVKKAKNELTEGKAKGAEVVATAASAIDTARRKGVLHKNTAARLKSRIAKKANAAAPAAK